jgi:hypothetical protein
VDSKNEISKVKLNEYQDAELSHIKVFLSVYRVQPLQFMMTDVESSAQLLLVV